MAAHDASQAGQLERFGEFQPLPDDCAYGRRITSTLGLLAHQLVHGSDRRHQETIDGVPVTISVTAGPVNTFHVPRVLGAVLRPIKPGSSYLVSAESHSLLSYPAARGCSPGECGVAHGVAEVSPAKDGLPKSVQGSVSATPELWASDGWILDRVAEATYDGASGYGHKTPLDPRESSLAREVLEHMLDAGHLFLDLTLQEYTNELTGRPTVATP